MTAFEFIDPTIVPFLGTFLFIFAIVFGLLTYSKLLGFSKNVNAVIAVVFGIFAASFEPLRVGLVQFLPILSIFLAVLFVLVFIQKIFNPDRKPGEKRKPFDAAPPLALAIVSFVLLGIFWDQIAVNYLVELDPTMRTNVLWLIGVLVVVTILAGIYYEGKGGET